MVYDFAQQSGGEAAITSVPGQGTEVTRKIVFMTGYIANAAAASEIAGIGDAVLAKPFKRTELADALQGALAS